MHYNKVTEKIIDELIDIAISGNNMSSSPFRA